MKHALLVAAEVLEIASDWNVKGIISANIRFCTHYVYDLPILKERLNQNGYPLLQLDMEYNQRATGQLGTRVQAFLEMVKNTGKSYDY